ncbi:unnamed protein product [Bursaphelenchus okinawaensis]|uniref:Uncharacterized protein n=1 Tax=Bursaphelenchus okinawaensis TaxID=465554 RepID=A0A811LEN7_9BILA|nr:unnamed protein product [Bursaphelenchus okinawaensis]CAG9121647.1 unnamed protein product [Bursaphelenchus okinawaensis]
MLIAEGPNVKEKQGVMVVFELFLFVFLISLVDSAHEQNNDLFFYFKCGKLPVVGTFTVFYGGSLLKSSIDYKLEEEDNGIVRFSFYEAELMSIDVVLKANCGVITPKGKRCQNVFKFDGITRKQQFLVENTALFVLNGNSGTDLQEKVKNKDFEVECDGNMFWQ